MFACLYSCVCESIYIYEREREHTVRADSSLLEVLNYGMAAISAFEAIFGGVEKTVEG